MKGSVNRDVLELGGIGHCVQTRMRIDFLNQEHGGWKCFHAEATTSLGAIGRAIFELFVGPIGASCRKLLVHSNSPGTVTSVPDLTGCSNEI